MKPIRAFVLTLLCAAALFLPRSARTVTTIYDSKTIPGSACFPTRASYGWVVGAAPTQVQPRSTWPTTNNGFLSAGSTPLYPPFTWNGAANTAGGDWQAACPLVNDSPSTAAGINQATVDLEHANSSVNLLADCWLEQCTTVMGNGDHGCCLGPVTHLTSGSLLTVKDFAATVTGIPYTSCGEGTHPYVYASVRCDLDIGTSVIGVTYNQVAGNNADW